MIENDGRLLLVRGQRPGVLQEMWEFPTLDSRLEADGKGNDGHGSPSPSSLRDALTAHLAAAAIPHGPLRHVGTIRHGITDRRITCHVFRAEASSQQPDATSPSAARARSWCRPVEIEALPLAASARKTLALLGS